MYVIFLLLNLYPSIGSAHGLPIDPNMPDAIARRLELTLSKLESIVLSDATPLHRQFFGPGLTGNVYISYLQRVQLFTYGPSEDLIIPSDDGEHSFYHAKCPLRDLQGEILRGFITGNLYEGKYHCDDRYDGSYAYEAVFLCNVAKYCESCSSEMRDEAISACRRYLRRVISRDALNVLLEDLQISLR